MKASVGISIFAALLLVSCNSSHIAKSLAPQPVGFTSPEPDPGPEKPVLSAEAVIDWPLLQNAVLNNCQNCHDEFKNQPGVVSSISDIWDEVSTDDMPPSKSASHPNRPVYPKLTDCQKATLKKWMDLGEPATSAVTVGTLPECANLGATSPTPTIPDIPPVTAAPNPVPQPPPVTAPAPPQTIAAMPLTYQTLYTQIFQPKCSGCHRADSQSNAKDILFAPYNEFQRRADLWTTPGQASKIIQAVSRTDDKRMPPPPRNAALSVDEINFITRWIDAGLPQ